MIKFTKMHGLGNDFIVINNLDNQFTMEKFPVRELSHRFSGIGFDQLLLIEKSTKADVACRIYNSDGSEAEQCGNGMRCVARFLHEEKFINKNSLSIETKAGIIEAKIKDYDAIEIAMGAPEILPPLDMLLDTYALKLSVISMGNPHAILKVVSAANSPVQSLGQQISTHSYFPNGTNVGFMEIVNREHIRLRTYERGAGETLACGSNACAAVVAGIQQNILDNEVKVELALGQLKISWQKNKSPVLMTGPASRVFDGNINN